MKASTILGHTYINYLFYILKAAYTEFEERVGQTAEPKGAKTALVVSAIDRLSDPFSVADTQRHCPGVGLDMIRKILKRERQAHRVECTGLGRGAAWRKTAKWKPGNG